MTTQIQMLKEILEDIPFIVCFHDLGYTMEWANRSCREFADFSTDAISDKSCYMVWRLGKPCTGCPMKQVIQTGVAQTVQLPQPEQFVWPHAQGTWILTLSPVKDKDNRVAGIIETAFEITTAQQALRSLRENEIRTRTAQSLSRIGHWELDIQTNKLYWSDEI